MQLNIEATQKRLEELFSGNYVFRVPVYQRSYAWEVEKASQLLDDLIAAYQEHEHRSGYDYFIGTFIFCKDDYQMTYEIVDGQQRLITLLLILAVLRDKFSSDNKEDLHKYIVRDENSLSKRPRSIRVVLRERDSKLFETWLGEPGSTCKPLTEGDSESLDKIRDVLTELHDELKGTSSAEAKKLALYILNNCKCIFASTSSTHTAHALFKSVNSPGTPLTEIELVRSLVFGEMPDMREKKKLADAWDFMEDKIGVPDFENYIRIVANTITNIRKTDDLYDIYEKIARDRNSRNNFGQKILAFASMYFDVEHSSLNVGDASPAVQRSLRFLNALNSDEWRSAALLWLANSGSSTSHTPIETAKFFRALEALCLGMAILKLNESKRSSRWRRVMDRISSGDVLSSSTSELYLSQAERQKISEILDKPIPKGSAFLKPLLLRLNAEIADGNFQFILPDKAELEHVLPQRPAANSEWARIFPQEAERRKLADLLGNYALVSRASNARGGNKSFHEKKQIYFKLGDHQSFAITSNITTFDDWTPDVIIERTRTLRQKTQGILDPLTI
jgi:uncharacterized protein with ParB-like and HNH nuclease domain